MSIARDEAEKYFPTQYWPGMEPNGDYLGKECYIEGIQSCDIQDVYIQGRTAEGGDGSVRPSCLLTIVIITRRLLVRLHCRGYG